VQTIVYEYVCRSLFKADRQMFVLHLVHGIYPKQFEKQEWEYFCGMLVSAVLQGKESLTSLGSTLPPWVDEERYPAISSFKNTFSNLYTSLELSNEQLWNQFGKSSKCEQEFPTALSKKISQFQQVMVIQVLRPDRLESAMNAFAAKSLGLKALPSASLNMKRLIKETNAKEPILIIVSPGSDPSQELQELANQTVGGDRYHQVAMGQGQSEIAMKLLSDCSKNGDWLCLKNLHLVTNWLPNLEKVINSLQPNEGFRLWMTAETHPKFPTILLQSSLKVTLEAPPGIKKNMQRSYESWSSSFVQQKDKNGRAQTLFALAWVHALLEERRKYIPQGWTKFYEFSMADLRAGADIIDRLYKKAGNKGMKWDFLHGLFENAIYGGRVDNIFDVRVLTSYLMHYFSDSLVGGSRGKDKLFPENISLPGSSNYKEFTDVVANLSEEDKPSLFGLPANIDRSAQRIISGQVITQLKILMRPDISSQKFDKDKWATELAPILNLWKKLNQGSKVLHDKYQLPNDSDSTPPVDSFVQLEHYNAIQIVQNVHSTLSSLAKTIKGSQLLSPSVQALAISLMHHETPAGWMKLWDNGPEDPVQWLKAIMQKTLALEKWTEKVSSRSLFNNSLNLAELFHPDTFLNALRQQTARSSKKPIDQLKLVSSWKSNSFPDAKHQVKIEGLLLEGCSFDGNKLIENERTSSSVSNVSLCSLAWIPMNQPEAYSADECILLPIYYTLSREKIVAQIKVPCDGDQNKWIKCGAAMFLKND